MGSTYRFHVRDWEPVRSQVAKDLVVEQLLFNRVVEINVLILEIKRLGLGEVDNSDSYPTTNFQCRVFTAGP